MNIYCIYTPKNDQSIKSAEQCKQSAINVGIPQNRFNLYPAIIPSEMHNIHEYYDIKCKYKPVSGSRTDFIKKTAPRARIANGTTHYLLYLECVSLGEPIIIVEHDAYFINRPPEENDIPSDCAIIQISSHSEFQMTSETLHVCGRAKKMKQHEPNRNYDFNWDQKKGIVPHPLSGTNGTSGYIITPMAANKMIKYIETDGIAFADRLRKEHVGEDSIFIQNPQSVFCHHRVKSSQSYKG